MAVRTYYRQDGEILSEDSDGSVLDFLTDALGSVTATVDQTATIQSKARYKPYGDLLSGSVLRMAWVGSLGYRPTGLAFSNYYMKARHYGSKQGQWTTKDALWLLFGPYSYGSSNPALVTDPSGNSPNYRVPGIKLCSACGYAYVVWNMKMSKDRSGYLIQHVQRSGQTTMCGSSKHSPPHPCSDYYEVWRVRQGVLVKPYDKCNDYSNDSCWGNQESVDQWDIGMNVNCTHGSFTMTGTMYFSKTYPAGFKQGGATGVPGGFSCSAGLPSSLTFNSNGAEAIKDMDGTATLTFACCAPQKHCVPPPRSNCDGCPSDNNAGCIAPSLSIKPDAFTIVANC